MFALEQKGLRYGEWGMTALEAASLGKIVVTNFLSIDRYKKEYGECPLVICNTEGEFERRLHELSEMNKDDILKLKKETRKWVEEKHSLKAVGKRLKRYYEELF